MLNSELNDIIKRIEKEQQLIHGNSLESSLLMIARQALTEYSACLNDRMVASVPFDPEGRLLFNGVGHEE